MKKFDIVVLGGGSGLNVAAFAARKGLDVAVIEPGPMGGTCLNRGCIPSKMLIEAAEVAQTIARSSTFGIASEIKDINFKSIMERTMDFVDEEAAGIEEAIKKHPRYTLFKHFARFTGPKTLSVGKEEIEGEKIVIAAGSRPFIPPIKGLDKVPYHTSDTIFRLKEQPKHVIFVGGGYISCEMAHFFGSLGSKVTVINRSPGLLSREDKEISQTFVDSFSQKYQPILNATVVEVSPTGEGIGVKAEQDGKTNAVEGDLLFIATGRVPNTDSLGCEEAGYALKKETGCARVNEYMETSVPGVWALGDIVGIAPFKHGANYEAKLVMANAFGGKKQAADYSVMPHAVFSSPQVAGVGLTEEEARESGLDYVVGRYEYIKTGMGKALEEKEGFVKIIADRKRRTIVGAHILGVDASVLVHELIVAIKAAGGSVAAIRDSIHIHPALPEVVQRAVNSISFEGKAEKQVKTLSQRTAD
ncbi:FAD-dependent oxidoreductase [Candidatus Saccharibacteria bacterium]|nr:FAD-dependent oxidoreductase [Candidatus Saccharibacteria bacterium]